MYGDDELVKGAPGTGLVAGGRGLSLRRGWGAQRRSGSGGHGELMRTGSMGPGPPQGGILEATGGTELEPRGQAEGASCYTCKLCRKALTARADCLG